MFKIAAGLCVGLDPSQTLIKGESPQFFPPVMMIIAPLFHLIHVVVKAVTGISFEKLQCTELNQLYYLMTI